MSRCHHLAQLIASHMPEPGICRTPVERVSFIRSDTPTDAMPTIYEASLCLIAQGSKSVTLGDKAHIYDAQSYLVVSIDLPLIGRVLEASRDKPYLCCKIDFEPAMLTELVMQESHAAPSHHELALGVYPADNDLTDAVCRLAELSHQPDHIDTLVPLVEREIIYRLLCGPQGSTLRRIVQGDNRIGRVSKAISFIRNHYHETIRIEDIATAAGMSPSSLHTHFKCVTTLTPLEFQKQLRLESARHLMISGGIAAADAAFAVGYQSPSQFSREYRRLFGKPPRKDVDMFRSLLSVDRREFS